MRIAEPVDSPGDLDARWHKLLVGLGPTRTYPPNVIIIQEGERQDFLFLIQEGSGKIFSLAEDGRMITFARYRAGDLLGEPTIDGTPRTASVMTTKRTVCTMIRAAAFRDLVVREPEFALHVISRLIHLLKISNARVKSLALDNVYQRVTRHLTELFTFDNGDRVIAPKPTQTDIAECIGASREMVNRVLTSLERGEYIRIERDRISILRKFPADY